MCNDNRSQTEYHILVNSGEGYNCVSVEDTATEARITLEEYKLAYPQFKVKMKEKKIRVNIEEYA